MKHPFSVEIYNRCFESAGFGYFVVVNVVPTVETVARFCGRNGKSAYFFAYGKFFAVNQSAVGVEFNVGSLRLFFPVSFNFNVGFVNVVRGNAGIAVEPTEESVTLFGGNAQRVGVKFSAFIERYGGFAVIFATVGVNGYSHLFNVSRHKLNGVSGTLEYGGFGNGHVRNCLVIALARNHFEFPTNKSVTLFNGNGQLTEHCRFGNYLRGRSNALGQCSAVGVEHRGDFYGYGVAVCVAKSACRSHCGSGFKSSYDSADIGSGLAVENEIDSGRAVYFSGRKSVAVFNSVTAAADYTADLNGAAYISVVVAARNFIVRVAAYYS